MSTSPVQPYVLTIPKARLLAADCEAIRELLIAAVESGQPCIILDMGPLQFLDSSLLGVLLVIRQRLKATGGALRLCNVSRDVRAILTLVKMDRCIDIHATLADARRACLP